MNRETPNNSKSRDSSLESKKAVQLSFTKAHAKILGSYMPYSRGRCYISWGPIKCQYHQYSARKPWWYINPNCSDPHLGSYYP